ncbi:MAG TPA: 30S ribosomal protein S16 [Promineifilum sp.]|nr:30S ribosomal protein S16 [Promineifilum sp.]
MLRIRLSRTGKKRQPSYRVVVAEKESKRDGRIVESIGHYNPLTNPATFQIKEDRALYWMSVGAQPSDAVRVLLNKQGTFDRLARLQAGESLDALVTEYTGVAPVAVAASSTPSMVERTSEAAGGVVEAVAVAAEKVEDATETAVDQLAEAVDGVLDADEEE